MATTGRDLLSAFVQVMISRMNSLKFQHFFSGQKWFLSDLLEKLKAKMVSVRSALDDVKEKQSTEDWLVKLEDAVYGADDLLDEAAFEALRCILEDEPRQQALKFRNTMKEKFEKLLNELEFIAGKDKYSSQALESSPDISDHLKLCCEYCAILPKGYEFGKEDLILLWMGAGLLTEMSAGHNYFDKLLSESFFQQSSGDYPIPLFSVTNDHSARFVPGDFCFKMEANVSTRDAKRIRHASATAGDAFQQLEFIHEAQSLQTFFALKPSNSQTSNYMNEGVLEFLMLMLKRLRVLCLSGYENITELSNSIGNLKYLRYLNLSRTAIKRLPEYVCGLYFLEILILNGCKEFIELPINLQRLINLSHLDARGTRLQGMPPQLGALTKLQTLTDFVVGKESCSSITELGMLQHLQGELCVSNLQYVSKAEDASKANLEGKQMLRKLELMWDGNADSSNKVLEKLQPHMTLEHLVITRYGGTRYPDWLGNPGFKRIVSLNLRGCKKCSSLPPVWQLPCLQELSITEFQGIKTIDLDFCGNSGGAVQKPFASLKILRFERMPNWVEWKSDEVKEKSMASSGSRTEIQEVLDVANDTPTGTNYTAPRPSHQWEISTVPFPLLEELYIIDCPKLKGTLPGFLPCLTTLEIKGCGLRFGDLLPSAPSVFKMGLKDNSGLLQLLELPSGMRCLTIDKIPPLQFVLDTMKKESGLCATIEVIHITRCNSTKYFSLDYFPNLKRLDINGCQELLSLFEHEAVPEISSSSETMEHRQLTGKFPLIQEFYLRDCPKLTKALLGNLPSLQVIYVSRCHSLKSLPFNFVPNLKRLDISGCSNLESLLSSDTSNFPLLQELYTRQCPKLIKALPTHLPSLTILESEGCHKMLSSSLPDTPAIRRIKLKADTCHVVLEKSELEIRNWDSLKCFPMDMFRFHELKTIRIVSCENIESLSRSKGLGDFKSLSSMEIWGCSKLVSFPKGGFFAPKLTLLSLRSCKALKSLPEDMHSLLPSLQDLQLIECAALEFFPLPDQKSPPSKLKLLEIQGCDKLFAGRKLQDLRALSSLTRFIFGMCQRAESFPGDMLLPSTVQHLEIEDCQNVKSLDKELNLLSSLTTFTISNCPKLESMSEEGLPASLSSLSICNCPLLETQDWYKTSRIQYIKINYCQIKRDQDLKTLSINSTS